MRLFLPVQESASNCFKVAFVLMNLPGHNHFNSTSHKLNFKGKIKCTAAGHNYHCFVRKQICVFYFFREEKCFTFTRVFFFCVCVSVNYTK